MALPLLLPSDSVLAFYPPILGFATSRFCASVSSSSSELPSLGQVPPPAGGTEEVATVRVSGTGNNISFEEKKTVLIQRQGHGTFVQTDKPIYKPGQRGKRHTYGVGQKAGDTAAGILQQGFVIWWQAYGIMRAEEGRSGRGAGFHKPKGSGWSSSCVCVSETGENVSSGIKLVSIIGFLGPPESCLYVKYANTHLA